MTSKPLFISVAESTVILAPMRQLGCCRACSTVISAKRSFGSVRKGPPEAVKMSRSTASHRSPMRHCSAALCSLSMGRMGTPARRAASVTIAPALTSTSLLARAMGIPACSAARVGQNPLRSHQCYDHQVILRVGCCLLQPLDAAEDAPAEGAELPEPLACLCIAR
jgi:hypothetical protein